MKKMLLGLVVLFIVVTATVLILGGNNENPQSADDRGMPADMVDAVENTYANLKGANIGKVMDARDKDSIIIEVDDFIYKTTVLKISRGTTIIWKNVGGLQHDVATADSSEITGVDSGLLSTNETFSYTFDESGRFDYFCSPHPFQMRGVVVVK